MLSCRDVSERATAIVDGDLGVWEMFQVRLHLAMCKGCTAFISQMRATRELIKAVRETPDAAADGPRIDAILAALHDRKQSGG